MNDHSRSVNVLWFLCISAIFFYLASSSDPKDTQDDAWLFGMVIMEICALWLPLTIIMSGSANGGALGRVFWIGQIAFIGMFAAMASGLTSQPGLFIYLTISTYLRTREFHKSDKGWKDEFMKYIFITFNMFIISVFVAMIPIFIIFGDEQEAGFATNITMWMGTYFMFRAVYAYKF